MLTAYDATFAAVADAAGVECPLAGDSLGMVCQGLPSTVGVTLETMAYHTASVARGLHRVQGTAWLIADLPFGSYHESREQALRSASAPDAGRGAHGQARRRRVDDRYGALPGRARHPRVRPPGPHTPDRARPGRLPRAVGKTDQAAQALRRQARELRDAGALHAGAGNGAGPAVGRTGPRSCSIATPSALARAAAPQARCWSCTTCWA